MEASTDANRTRKDAGRVLYDPLEHELVGAREWARDLCHDLNTTREGDQDAVVGLFGVMLSFSGTVRVLKTFALHYGLRRVLAVVGIRDRQLAEEKA